jgi:hypothetical protein
VQLPPEAFIGEPWELSTNDYRGSHRIRWLNRLLGFPDQIYRKEHSMGHLAVMGKEGDTKVIWAAANQAEVDTAKRTFDDLKKKGYAAFSVNPNGSQGAKIDTFDPQAEAIIMVPPMQGG